MLGHHKSSRFFIETWRAVKLMFWLRCGSLHQEMHSRNILKHYPHITVAGRGGGRTSFHTGFLRPFRMYLLQLTYRLDAMETSLQTKYGMND